MSEENQSIAIDVNSKNTVNKKPRRSEALKKAQKKYYEKIKNENSEVYKKLRSNHSSYQKDYIKNKRLNNEDFNKQYMEKQKVHSKNFYYNNKEKILEQRRIIRERKKDEYLETFIQNTQYEISFDL